MADAVALVHAVAAELGDADILAERLTHDPGAGQEHARVLSHHDPVGQRRRVGAAAGREAGDDRDLRDLARERDRPPEDPPVAAERARRPPACGRRRSRRSRRPAPAPGRPARARARSSQHGPRRASRRRRRRPGRSRRRAGHRPARRRRRHRRPARALSPIVGRDDLRADHVERAGVAQRLESLDRGQRRLRALGALECRRSSRSPHSITVAPHVKPAPKAPSRTRSPARSRPRS